MTHDHKYFCNLAAHNLGSRGYVVSFEEADDQIKAVIEPPCNGFEVIVANDWEGLDAPLTTLDHITLFKVSEEQPGFYNMIF